MLPQPPPHLHLEGPTLKPAKSLPRLFFDLTPKEGYLHMNGNSPSKSSDKVANSKRTQSTAISSSRPSKLQKSNDDLEASKQPKICLTSWQRSRSHQHVRLGSQPLRRTLLEFLPREVILMILSNLSLSDLRSLMKADRRVRPMVHSKSFVTWRKRLAQFLYCERKYDELVSNRGDKMFELGNSQLSVPSTADSGNTVAGKELEVEKVFLKEYREVLTAMKLNRAPSELSGLIPTVAKTLPKDECSKRLQHFAQDLILGRRLAKDVFTGFEAWIAVEFLSFVRLFLAVVRVSRGFLPTALPSQTMHVLDSDCRETIRSFFGPTFPAASGSGIQLTEEQARFVNHDVFPGQIVKVQAFAGTGKTQSLMAYAAQRPRKRFLYIAFNAAAAKSAKYKFPSNVECRTMHSVALAQVTLPLNQKLGNIRPREVISLLDGQLPTGRDMKVAATQSDKLSQSVVATYILRTLQKYFYSDDLDIEADKHVPYQTATDTDLSVERLAECAKELWGMIKNGTSKGGNVAVRCPHDAYVKLLHLRGARYPDPFFKAYDVLLLDEAQDLSAAQTSILLRAKRQCSILIVGDVHQKIYGFRGGTAKAFDNRAYPANATFQLTRSFRFGDEVAKVASKVLGLKAAAFWEDRPMKPTLSGVRRSDDRVYCEKIQRATPSMGMTQMDSQTLADEGITAECVAAHTRIYRSNKNLCLDALRLAATLPLPHKLFLKTAQSLRKHAIIALLRDGYILYTNSSSSMSQGSILREFSGWKELQERFKADDGGGDTQLGLVAQLSDLFAASDFSEKIQMLERRFAPAEEEATVILTTCHQAKGLEWDKVVVADDFRPSFDSPNIKRVEVKGTWFQDELNHMYVAITRAKKELVVSQAVVKWLVALEGWYNFAVGKDRTQCPFCKNEGLLVARRDKLDSHDFLRIDEEKQQEQILGCLNCLQGCNDEEVVEYVQTAARLLQLPVPSQQQQDQPLVCFPFLDCKHRLTVWAMMHDNFKQAVHRWLM